MNIIRLKSMVLPIINLACLLVGIQVSLASAEWKSLPIRSQAEYENGAKGGGAEQHLHGICRSRYNPDRIYASQDILGAWRSDDGGETWQKTLDKGRFVRTSTAIEVDPVDPDIAYIISHANWDEIDNQDGIYRTTDGGDSWKLVLETNTHFSWGNHRRYSHAIAYALSSADSAAAKIAQVWYSALPKNGLYKSIDGGETWSSQAISTFTDADSIVYSVQVDPQNADKVFVATSTGLYVSSTGGTNLTRAGNSPEEIVTSIEINSKDPQMMFITTDTTKPTADGKYEYMDGNRFYKSEDGGETWVDLGFKKAAYVFMHPTFPSVMAMPKQHGEPFETTLDGGKTWFPVKSTTSAPGFKRDEAWRSRHGGNLTGIAFNPQDSLEYVIYSHATFWKTEDGGETFREVATGYTGVAWSWYRLGAAFDRWNPERFAFFNCDLGMRITTNGGKWFHEGTNDEVKTWYGTKQVKWYGTHSGDFEPVKGSKKIIANVGMYWNTRLMMSEDEGQTWRLLIDPDLKHYDPWINDPHYFVKFNPEDPQIIYAGDKISWDGGATFDSIDFGDLIKENAMLIDLSESDPNTVWALGGYMYDILVSRDKGLTWSHYFRANYQLKGHDRVPVVAADPFDNNTIYTMTRDGRFVAIRGKSNYYTMKDTWGENHYEVDLVALSGGKEHTNYIRTITCDPKREGVIYAGMYNGGYSSVFRSKDRGKTWEDITENLPRSGAHALAVNPHTGELFLGSAFGTWIYPSPDEPISVNENNDYVSLKSWGFQEDGYLNIEGIAAGEIIDVEIFNTSGKKVFVEHQSSEHRFNLQVHNFVSGNYILKIVNSQGNVQTSRFDWL